MNFAQLSLVVCPRIVSLKFSQSLSKTFLSISSCRNKEYRVRDNSIVYVFRIRTLLCSGMNERKKIVEWGRGSGARRKVVLRLPGSLSAPESRVKLA